jgi:glycosyltransferase involved in cell wall biosynthesis
MKTTFIVWGRYAKHSEQVARSLGASIRLIQWGRRDRALEAPLRYLVQAVITWWHLLRERPDAVLVQNPPIFAPLTAFLYARLFGARLLIDSHSGAFLSPRWQWSVGLHRALSRWSALTIVHNRAITERLRGWHSPVLVVAYVPDKLPEGESYPFEAEPFRVAVVSTMAEDEPLDVIFDAAGRLPDVGFYVTGRPERLDARLRPRIPANCRLTGYLSDARYAALLRGADAVLDLTLQGQTVLMGGFEAVAVGTPLITSDWPVLREYFRAGAVHVPNTVEGICEGVRRVQCEQPALRRGIVALRRQLEREWCDVQAELRRRVGAATETSRQRGHPTPRQPRAYRPRTGGRYG